MLKVNNKISLSNQVNMNELKELRKSGKWIVTNRKMTIIKFIGTEQKAKEFFNIQRKKRGGADIFGALQTVTITKEDQIKAHKIQNAIWRNK